MSRVLSDTVVAEHAPFFFVISSLAFLGVTETKVLSATPRTETGSPP